MLCPKDKSRELTQTSISEGLTGERCSECNGVWIAAEQYIQWQAKQPHGDLTLPEPLDVQFEHSPLDVKGALCPGCGHYLSRARIGLVAPFYIERCGNCGGIWCDSGEWEALEKLGLNTTVQQLFSYEWKTLLRQRELAEQEQREMIERLGPELSEAVRDLASRLKEHPERDFALAYLMRTVTNTSHRTLPIGSNPS